MDRSCLVCGEKPEHSFTYPYCLEEAFKWQKMLNVHVPVETLLNSSCVCNKHINSSQSTLQAVAKRSPLGVRSKDNDLNEQRLSVSFKDSESVHYFGNNRNKTEPSEKPSSYSLSELDLKRQLGLTQLSDQLPSNEIIANPLWVPPAVFEKESPHFRQPTGTGKDMRTTRNTSGIDVQSSKLCLSSLASSRVLNFPKYEPKCSCGTNCPQRELNNFRCPSQAMDRKCSPSPACHYHTCTLNKKYSSANPLRRCRQKCAPQHCQPKQVQVQWQSQRQTVMQDSRPSFESQFQSSPQNKSYASCISLRNSREGSAPRPSSTPPPTPPQLCQIQWLPPKQTTDRTCRPSFESQFPSSLLNKSYASYTSMRHARGGSAQTQTQWQPRQQPCCLNVGSCNQTIQCPSQQLIREPSVGKRRSCSNVFCDLNSNTTLCSNFYDNQSCPAVSRTVLTPSSAKAPRKQPCSKHPLISPPVNVLVLGGSMVPSYYGSSDRRQSVPSEICVLESELGHENVKFAELDVAKFTVCRPPKQSKITGRTIASQQSSTEVLVVSKAGSDECICKPSDNCEPQDCNEVLKKQETRLQELEELLSQQQKLQESIQTKICELQSTENGGQKPNSASRNGN